MPFENNGGCSSVDDVDVVIPVAHWGGDVHVACRLSQSTPPAYSTARDLQISFFKKSFFKKSYLRFVIS